MNRKTEWILIIWIIYSYSEYNSFCHLPHWQYVAIPRHGKRPNTQLKPGGRETRQGIKRVMSINSGSVWKKNMALWCIWQGSVVWGVSTNSFLLSAMTFFKKRMRESRYSSTLWGVMTQSAESQKIKPRGCSRKERRRSKLSLTSSKLQINIYLVFLRNPSSC